MALNNPTRVDMSYPTSLLIPVENTFEFNTDNHNVDLCPNLIFLCDQMLDKNIKYY